MDIESINTLVFKPCDIVLSEVIAEKEGRAYNAHSFQLNSLNVKYRSAKITPTKAGQFVTIWKRNELGITVPYAIQDDIEFYLIGAEEGTRSGLFIFPKEVLYAHKILADTERDGKRGIRVYPSWTQTSSKQAHKTQAWQLEYFIDFSEKEEIFLARSSQLLKGE